MKKIWIDLLLVVIMCILIPFFFFLHIPNPAEKIIEEPRTSVPLETEPMKIPVSTVSVLLTDGRTVPMAIDDYVTGVLLGEMPAGFEKEALKAQAVAVRTFAMKQKVKGSKHPNGAVCTDSACCQAYLSEAEYKARGGENASIAKIRECVKDTSQKVLTYEGYLIEATYFSCSGGQTEAAVQVWGADVPYLQSVPSPGEDQAKGYVQTVTFSEKKFRELLGISNGAIRVENITYTGGKGVAQIVINGKKFSGIEIRKLLGLRSTIFRISTVGDTVAVTTKGHGHRVGLSQYGAQAMAENGSTYQEILAHYYPGTDISAIPDIDK